RDSKCEHRSIVSRARPVFSTVPDRAPPARTRSAACSVRGGTGSGPRWSTSGWRLRGSSRPAPSLSSLAAQCVRRAVGGVGRGDTETADVLPDHYYRERLGPAGARPDAGDPAQGELRRVARPADARGPTGVTAEAVPGGRDDAHRGRPGGELAAERRAGVSG